MSNFAKLFNIEDSQVLIVKEILERKSTEFLIVQTTETKEGNRLSFRIVFKSEEKRNNAFDEYLEENAIEFLKAVNFLEL